VPWLAEHTDELLRKPGLEGWMGMDGRKIFAAHGNEKKNEKAKV
jgi:hypothetical protein